VKKVFAGAYKIGLNAQLTDQLEFALLIPCVLWSDLNGSREYDYRSINGARNHCWN
jgi:hypothetical protein